MASAWDDEPQGYGGGGSYQQGYQQSYQQSSGGGGYYDNDEQQQQHPYQQQQQQDQQQSELYEYDNTGAGGAAPAGISEYKKEIMDNFGGGMDRTLLIPKLFYFFFFAAFGSLFPLMGIYFKQMAMTPSQVGVLFGMRLFVEFVAAPFWANVGERWRKGKIILLASIVCLILFALALSLIRPPVHSCLMTNGSHVIVQPVSMMSSQQTRSKRSVFSMDQEEDDVEDFFDGSSSELLSRNKRQDEGEYDYVQKGGQWYKVVKEKKKPTSNDDDYEYVQKNGQWYKVVKQTVKKTTTTTKKSKTKKPPQQQTTTPEPEEEEEEAAAEEEEKPSAAQEALDTAVEQVAEEAAAATKATSPVAPPMWDNYYTPKQLEDIPSKSLPMVYLTAKSVKLMKPHLDTGMVYEVASVQRIFWLFLFLTMVGEFFSAPAITLADACTLNLLGPARADLYGRQRMFGSLGWALSMFAIGLILDYSRFFFSHPCGKAGPGERNFTICFVIYSILMAIVFGVSTQFQFKYEDEQVPLKSLVGGGGRKPEGEEAGEMSDTGGGGAAAGSLEDFKLRYLRIFAYMKMNPIKYVTFLFFVWFMGIGVGLVFTFLFWHLQDIGGTPSLYGIASVINHVSELAAYFFVHLIVRKFGHVKLFYAGLIGNTIRFIYASMLGRAFWILPFEFIQGITHALVWSAAASHFAQSLPEDLRMTGQGLLQGLHFGLGRGCGAIFGGMIIGVSGTKSTFFVYGFLCFVFACVYFAINRYSGNLVQTQEEAAAAPQANPIMQDSNVFYQPGNNPHEDKYSRRDDLLTTNKSAFPIGPQGVPTTNPNWSRQFIIGQKSGV